MVKDLVTEDRRQYKVDARVSSICSLSSRCGVFRDVSGVHKIDVRRETMFYSKNKAVILSYKSCSPIIVTFEDCRRLQQKSYLFHPCSGGP